MPGCKRGPRPRRPAIAALIALSGLLAAGCAGSRPKTVTIAALERAPAAGDGATNRVVVARADLLRSACTPLGPRLGLLEVHDTGGWERLRQIAPEVGAPPDLDRGAVVGIACWAGTPADGRWPIMLTGVRVHDRAGLVEAHFRGGTYLPDGAACLELTYVPDLAAVVMVRVDDTPFFP